MAKKALALTYRPQTFSDVVEQDAIKLTLMEQLKTNSIQNCYLFTGGAGTGKTTDGRIFAREINKGIGEPIELDAASNNSVEDVRKIINDARYKSMTGEYKIYIIDECHAISSAGWQAFLKVIEEPPTKTVFIFCTTDPQKIPNTILSRVQRYDFKKISFSGIVNRLNYIIKEENKKGANIIADKDGIEYIAKLSDGGMRDSITTLDKCISYNTNLTLDNVIKALGSVNYETMFDLVDSIYNYDATSMIKTIEEIHISGANLKQFMKEFGNFVLDTCKYGLLNSFDYLAIPSLYVSKFKTYNADKFAFCNQLLGEINKLNNAIKWESSPKPMIESTFFLLCQKG